MNTELSSKYDPSAVESTAYQVWLEEKCFHADPAKPGEPYTIVMPPPNVTGALHLGHAINTTLQDILTRAHRMMGFNTLWVPGIDHAGIATQAVVEKQLKEQENKTRHDVGRDGLVERIWQWKQQYGDRILSQLQRLGCSCDWDRTRFTLDEMCAKAVRETFFKLFKDGLIYRGKRLVNWDTFLQTSISDDEIYHETVKTNLWHIRYEIDTSGMGGPPMSSAPQEQDHGRAARATYMIVATTRPETLLGDTAVAVHSEDTRWNWAIGKHVRLPLTNRLIPIIADDILVDPKFGTGVVKVTPAHDPNDYAVWQRHKGQSDEIEIINILTPDGKINADRPEWSKYAGMKRDAARKAVVEDLQAAGLLEKEEPYETQVGHSDRSKTAIEPYLSDQWFVKMAPLAEPALQVVRDGLIKFYPERHAQQYLAWLGEKRDWPVSRQLWWGHRIPVWSKTVKIPKTPDPFNPIDRLAFNGAKILDEKREQGTAHSDYAQIAGMDFRRGPGADEITLFVCATDPTEISGWEKLGFTQDPDVLDTWFSSALWPHSTLGWPDQTPELARYYPTSVLLTGRDIITLWVARMVMMGMYNMGEGTRDEATEGTRDEATEGTRDEATEGRREEMMAGGGGTGGPPVSSSAEQENHGRAARATTPALSPLYSGGRVGVRGETITGAGAAIPATPGPSSQPSPLCTGEKEPETAARRAEASKLGIPFLDVAINPTILDGKGERMSKSKGNGVDPVDIIDAYGADALRFTLTKMATETQDARMPVKRDAQGRNTSEKFDEGRNFCNKLWNACRFALTSVARASSPCKENSDSSGMSRTPAKQDTGWKPVPLGLPDQWIVSRFHHAVEESNNALKAYRFDVYAKTCYDFFWRDFCDWYVEAIKPAMKDPARSAATAQVLAAVLDGALRLMHPMIPFITETVWWRLNDVCPTRGLGDLLPCPPSKRLVLAQWPSAPTSGTPTPFSPGGHAGSSAESQNPAWPPGLNGREAEATFSKLQELIVAIRTIRNDYQVNPKTPVKVSIKAPDDLVSHIETSRELIELLATSTLQAVGPAIAAPANAVTANDAGAEIFVEGLIDANAENARLEKERDAKKKLIDSLRGRMANESYIAKAPPQLVQQTKDQLAAAEAELVKIEEALKKLK